MYLLDTNVISELRVQRRADTAVWAWGASIADQDLHVSVITLFELERGILRLERRDPRQASVLRAWFDSSVLPTFPGRTLVVDQRVALRAARLHVPKTRPERDAMIAATALVHNLTVVTRNVADFADTGVKLLNPWEA